MVNFVWEENKTENLTSLRVLLGYAIKRFISCLPTNHTADTPATDASNTHFIKTRNRS